MALETIRQIIARRDSASESDIDDMFDSAGEEFAEGYDPEEILAQVFGLEPDFFFDAEFQTALFEGGF